jgi:hypothetical protein
VYGLGRAHETKLLFINFYITLSLSNYLVPNAPSKRASTTKRYPIGPLCGVQSHCFRGLL